MSVARARDTALEFADRLQALGPLSVTRFFGGAGLAKNGVQFAFVIKDVLYLRVDRQTRPEFEALGSAPFAYGTRSKTVSVSSYYALPDEIADDSEALLRWMAKAYRAAAAAKC